MSNQITEQQVLERLNISNFTYLTKDKAMLLVPMLQNLSSNTIEKIIGHFPEFGEIILKTMNEKKDVFRESLINDINHFFSGKILEELKKEYDINPIYLNLGEYSMNDELAPIVKRIRNAISKNKTIALKKNVTDLIHKILQVEYLFIPYRIFTNFETELYTFPDCISSMDAVGDVDAERDRCYPYSLKLPLDKYLMLITCNSKPEFHIKAAGVHGDNAYDYTMNYKPSIELLDFSPVDKTLICVGSFEINNALAGPDILYSTTGEADISIEFTGLRDDVRHPDFIIYLAESLAFYGKKNFKMALLTMFSSLDSLIELLYSIAYESLSNSFYTSEFVANYIRTNIPDVEEYTPILEEVFTVLQSKKTDFEGERKKLLKHKLSPILKLVGFEQNNINSIMRAFKDSEKKRNAIAHGTECIVSEKEVADLLYSLLTMVTQLNDGTELHDYLLIDEEDYSDNIDIYTRRYSI